MEFKKRHSIASKCHLLHIHVGKESVELNYYFVQKSDKFSAAEKLGSIKDFKPPKSKFHPVIIHVTGFGVLTRLVEDVPNFKEMLMVSGNEEDFYFSHLGNTGKIVVSFIRKSFIQEITSYLLTEKYALYGIYVGPVPLVTNQTENKTIRSDYLIELTNNTIKTLEKLEVSSNFNYLPYIETFQHILFQTDSEIVQAISVNDLDKTKTDLREYRKFVLIGSGLLIFFLLTLTSNYFYVNHLNQLTADKEAELASFGASLSQLEQLNQERQRKLILLDNSGLQSSNFVSSYLDEIGESVPSQIQLTKLITFPLEEPLKPKIKAHLINDCIEVFGMTQNSQILDDWIEILQKKKWVSSVEMIHYSRTEGAKSSFHFKLKLVS